MSGQIENLKSFGMCALLTLPLGLATSTATGSLYHPSPRRLEYATSRREKQDHHGAACRAYSADAPQSHAPANRACDTDPFAEADEGEGETKQSQNYIHIRIQRKSLLR